MLSRIAAIALGLFTWGSVAACAHHMDQAAQSALTWNFHVYGDEAKLAYGQPNSDLVGVMLTCQRGAGSVMVSSDVSRGKPQLVLASGETKLRLTGPAEADPYTGGVYLQARAPARAPALRQFAETGDLRLVRDLRDTEMNASPAAKGDIRRFFAHCEA